MLLSNLLKFNPPLFGFLNLFNKLDLQLFNVETIDKEPVNRFL